MATPEIAAAMQRTQSVLLRRPQSGMHEDLPGMARWDGGTRVVTRHLNGSEIVTDLPDGLGGDGTQVTPGWLLRAGLAACTATRIAMTAAAQGIELDTLEVDASSRSDTRGLLGMVEDDGAPCYPGPRDLCVHVRIAARRVAPERLRALVQESNRCSPVLFAIQDAHSVALRIEIVDD
ncbi:MAG TPA: OsmC family protein [Burkholderiales bacterium]|jgi:uncharacterized OsmC-like protein|nr:OsmC family protein [Burkholderiales bacterium]